MNRRTFLHSAGALTLAALALSLAPARAGGFGIFVDLPRADNAPAALQDCALVVRPHWYHLVGAKVTYTLEGIVNGKRVTRDITPVRAVTGQSRHNVYGIRREWENEGRWVVSVVATTDPSQQTFKDGRPVGYAVKAKMVVLIPIGADGVPETRATPGGKYPAQLKIVRPAYEKRWTALASLLRPPASPALPSTPAVAAALRP